MNRDQLTTLRGGPAPFREDLVLEAARSRHRARAKATCGDGTVKKGHQSGYLAAPATLRTAPT